MAPLPKPFDARVHWIREKLHLGLRTEAVAMIEAAVAAGSAGADTLALAQYLSTAKRGRQPFGTTHLWYEIGLDNDELREAGVGYEGQDGRMERLGRKYQLNPRQIEAAVAKFERAMDEARAVDEENSSG
jgi:hypothetical protein